MTAAVTTEREDPRPRRFLPEAVLVGIAMLWGTTFLVTKVALGESGPLFFVALRFAIASAVLAIVMPSARRGWRRSDVTGAGSIGLAMVCGYALQTIGLHSIPSSTSAFITALYVPFVPILQFVLLRQIPRPMVRIGILMAFTGLVLLAGPSAVLGFRLGAGELLSVASAIAFSVQIILIGAFARRMDAGRAALIQLLTLSAGCFLLMPLHGEPVPVLSPTLLACAAYLGVASAVIQVAMNWGQRHVSPARATLIYAAEPVYAGMIGWAAGERLGPVAIIGGILIVASVIVSELRLGSAVAED